VEDAGERLSLERRYILYFNLDKLPFVTQIPISMTRKLNHKGKNVLHIMHTFPNDSHCSENNSVGLHFEKKTRGESVSITYLLISLQNRNRPNPKREHLIYNQSSTISLPISIIIVACIHCLQCQYRVCLQDLRFSYQ
jgi:hypothetical protein